MFLATTSLEIGDLKHSEVPPSMIPLFPVTLPNSSLHRMILDEYAMLPACKLYCWLCNIAIGYCVIFCRDFEAQPAVYAYMDVKREIESQVEQVFVGLNQVKCLICSNLGTYNL